MAAKIGDQCYKEIGVVGRGNTSAMASLGQRLGLSSGNAKALYVGPNNSYLDGNNALYLYGREDGFPGDKRPTINHIQGTINTFSAMATRVSPSIVLKSSTSGDDDLWILTKPFTFHAPRDQMTGLPAINPNTGMPFQDVVLQLYEPIPEEIVDYVPSHRRWCRNPDNVTKWQQINFDAKRRQCSLDGKTIRDLVFRSQLDGWPMGLVEWDSVLQNFMIDIYEPQQWFPDPIKQDVDQMSYVRLDIPMDTEEAKRRYPHIADFIEKNGSRTLYFENGSYGYSAKYTDVVYETPMVTVVHIWLRNQPAPMTLDEALSTGMAAWQEQELQGEQGAEAGAMGVEPGTEAPAPQEGLEGETSDQPTGPDDQESNQGSAPAESELAEVPETQPSAPARRLIHARTGDDISDSFHSDGSPGAMDEKGERRELHGNHPMKYIVRHWIQIRDQVAPGSDEVCEWPDMPIFLGRNVPIKGRPFSQPETERLRSPQITLNNVHTAIVDHCAFFRVPTMLMAKDIAEKVDPDLINGNIRIGKWYTIEADLNNFDINKVIYQIQPSQLPAALPLLKADIGNEFQTVAGNPGVNQGTPPPGVTAGTAIAELQAQSQASAGFKSMYLEVAIERIAMLMNHALVYWQTLDDIMKYNRSLPREIVEKWVLPFLRNEMSLGVEVSLPTGAGQIRAQKEQQTLERFQAGLVDEETAQDMLDLPTEEIQRRKKEARQQLAEEQAEMQAQMQPQPAPQ